MEGDIRHLHYFSSRLFLLYYSLLCSIWRLTFSISWNSELYRRGVFLFGLFFQLFDRVHGPRLISEGETARNDLKTLCVQGLVYHRFRFYYPISIFLGGIGPTSADQVAEIIQTASHDETDWYLPFQLTTEISFWKRRGTRGAYYALVFHNVLL